MRRRRIKRRTKKKIRRRIRRIPRKATMLTPMIHMVKDGKKMEIPSQAKKSMLITWMISCVLINIKNIIEENQIGTMIEKVAQAEDVVGTQTIKSNKIDKANTSMTMQTIIIEAEKILKELLMEVAEVDQGNTAVPVTIP